MTQSTTDLTKALSVLSKQAQAVREAITAMRGCMAELEAEQARLMALPLNKADFLEICLAGVDKQADTAAPAWVSYFAQQGQVVNGGGIPTFNVGSLWNKHAGGGVNVGGMRVLSAGQVLLRGDGPMTEEAVFWLFRDQIKAAIRASFEQMGDLNPDAAPAESHFPRLKEIADKLAETRAMLREMEAAAKEHGVDIPAEPEVYWVADVTEIQEGQMLGLDGNDYAVPLKVTEGARYVMKVVGVALECVGKSHGSKKIKVGRGVFRMKNGTGEDQCTVLGAPCYATGPASVASTSDRGERPLAGKVVSLAGHDVLVEFA